MGEIANMVKADLSATADGSGILVDKLQNKIEEIKDNHPNAVKPLRDVIEIVMSFGGTNMDEAVRAAEEADRMLGDDSTGITFEGLDVGDGDVPEASSDPPAPVPVLTMKPSAKPSRSKEPMVMPGGNVLRPPPPASAVVEIEETPKPPPGPVIPAQMKVNGWFMRDDPSFRRARQAMIAWPIRLLKSRWSGWVVAAIMFIAVIALVATLLTTKQENRNHWFDHYNQFHPGTNPFNP